MGKNGIAERTARALVRAYKDLREEPTKPFPGEAFSIRLSPAGKKYFSGSQAEKAITRASGIVAEALDAYPTDALKEELWKVLLQTKDHNAALEMADATMKDHVAALISRLSVFGEWEVVMGVSGLDPTDGPVQIGRCRFIQFTEEDFTLWGRRFSTGLYAPPPNAPVVDSWVRHESKLIGQRVAIVRLQAADANHARAIAASTLEQSLNLWRYGQVTAVGFKSTAAEARLDAAWDHSHSLCMCLDSRDVSTTQSFSSTQGLRFSTVATAPGWKQLDDILSSGESQRSELARRALVALEWIGQAALARSAGVRLVALATALESLVILQSESRGKKAKLAKRASCVLARQGAERENLTRFIRKFYACRSDCVHGGETWVDPQLLEESKGIVCQCLAKIVAESPFNSMKSCQDLVDWVERDTQSASMGGL